MWTSFNCHAAIATDHVELAGLSIFGILATLAALAAVAVHHVACGVLSKLLDAVEQPEVVLEGARRKDQVTLLVEQPREVSVRPPCTVGLQGQRRLTALTD